MQPILERLKDWAEIQKIRPTEESPDVSGGRDAELMLKNLIGASTAFKHSHIFAGRRIPSRRQGRRREIDLIVCTPRMIHLIEVKNWSGRLELDRGRWRQHRRSGDVVDHGDLIKSNLFKQDAVVEYLQDRGVAIDERLIREHIVTEIIFMNRRLELDPAIEERPEIITRRELDKYLGQQPRVAFADQMFSTLIELCLSAESKRALKSHGPDAIPAAKFDQIVTYLAETMTWDQVWLHGSKAISGDLLRVQVGLQNYRKSDLVELTAGQPIRVRWTRHWLLGLLKAVLGLGPLGRLQLGKTKLAITRDDTVTFHAVGDEEPSTFRLVELDKIVLG